LSFVVISKLDVFGGIKLMILALSHVCLDDICKVLGHEFNVEQAVAIGATMGWWIPTNKSPSLSIVLMVTCPP
jgi:hypothetical protein